MKDHKRRKTGLIMASMSLFMASPIIMHLAGYRIGMFSSFGLVKGQFAPWYVWLVAFVVTILYVTYTFRAIPFVYRMQKELSLFKLIGLLSIIGGIVEEVVFRRWLMDYLLNNGFNLTSQVLISGLSFGLIHIIWGLFGGSAKFLKGAFISTSLFGCAMAIVYLIGGRNVGPCIVSHSIINIVIEPWLLLAAISKLGKKSA